MFALVCLSYSPVISRLGLTLINYLQLRQSPHLSEAAFTLKIHQWNNPGLTHLSGCLVLRNVWGWPPKGYVKEPYLSLQVATLRAKREQDLEELKNEVSNCAGVRMDKHPRKKLDAYGSWVRNAGQTATLREIEGERNGIQQLVRPLILKHWHFLCTRYANVKLPKLKTPTTYCTVSIGISPNRRWLSTSLLQRIF